MKNAVLPCNGLDKYEGVLTREIALRIFQQRRAEIVCPVLFNAVPARYAKTLDGAAVIVIDGCGTRCASKLAAEHGIRVAGKYLVTELVKESGVELEAGLVPGPAGLAFAGAVAESAIRDILREPEVELPSTVFAELTPPKDFLTVTHGKYIFNIPREGYLFNENDCWARVVGSRARVGVSDYVQQHMTDITYFEPTQVGRQVEQFDDLGSLESAKSLMDVLSPLSGTVVAVNTTLVDSPETVNDDPYGEGWVAELEVGDFESDRELLLGAEAYAEVVRRKAAGSES